MEEDNDYKLAFRRHFGTPSSGSESDAESNFLEHIKQYAPPPYDISEDNLVTISPTNAWLERANQNQVNIKNVQDHSEIVNSVSQNCNFPHSSQSASSQSTGYTETENITTEQNKNSINGPSKKKRKKDKLKNRVLNSNEKPNSRNTGVLTSQNINKNGKTKTNINVNVSNTKNSSDKKNLADKKSIKVIDEKVEVVDTNNSPNFDLISIRLEELTRQMMDFFETFTFPSQFYMTKESQIDNQPDNPIHVDDISFPPLPDCRRKSRIDISKTNTTDHGLPTKLHAAETPFPNLSRQSTKVQTDKNASTKKKLINNNNKVHNTVVKKNKKKLQNVDEFQTSQVQIGNESTTITFGDFIVPRVSDVPTKSRIEINETDTVGLSSSLNVPFKVQAEQNSSTKTNFVDDSDQLVLIDTITEGDVFYQNVSDAFRKSRTEVNGLPSLLNLDEIAFPSISCQSIKKPTKKSSTEKTSMNTTDQVLSTKKNEKKRFKKIDELDLELGFVYNNNTSRNVGTEQKGKKKKAKSNKVTATTVRKEEKMKNSNNIKEKNNSEQLTQMKMNATTLKASTKYSEKPECVQVLEDPVQLLAGSNQIETSNLAKESGVNNNNSREDLLCYNEMNKQSLSSTMISKLIQMKIDATTLKASTKYSEKPECVQVLEDPVQLLADSNQIETSNLARESGVNNNNSREDLLFYNEMNKQSLSSTTISNIPACIIQSTSTKKIRQKIRREQRRHNKFCVNLEKDDIFNPIYYEYFDAAGNQYFCMTQPADDQIQNIDSNHTNTYLNRFSELCNNVKEDESFNYINDYNINQLEIMSVGGKNDPSSIESIDKMSVIDKSSINSCYQTQNNGKENKKELWDMTTLKMNTESGETHEIVNNMKEDASLNFLYYYPMNKFETENLLVKVVGNNEPSSYLTNSIDCIDKMSSIGKSDYVHGSYENNGEENIKELWDMTTLKINTESGETHEIVNNMKEDASFNFLYYYPMNKLETENLLVKVVDNNEPSSYLTNSIDCIDKMSSIGKSDYVHGSYENNGEENIKELWDMTTLKINTESGETHEIVNNMKEDASLNFLYYPMNKLETENLLVKVVDNNEPSSYLTNSIDCIDKMSSIGKSDYVHGSYENNGEENIKELRDMTTLKMNTESGETHEIVNNMKEDASFNFLYYYPMNKLETENLLVKVVDNNEPSSYLTNSIDCIDKMSSIGKSDYVHGSYENNGEENIKELWDMTTLKINTESGETHEIVNNMKEDASLNFLYYPMNKLETENLLVKVVDNNVPSSYLTNSIDCIDKMSSIGKSDYVHGSYENNGEENIKELRDMTTLKMNTESGETHEIVNNMKEDARLNFLYYPMNKLETENLLVKVVDNNEPSSYLTNSIDCIDKMSSIGKSDVHDSYELKKNRKTNQVSTVPSLDEHMFSDNTKRLWLVPYETNCDHSAFEEPQKGKTCNKTEPKIINCKKSILGQFEEENVEELVNSISEDNDAATSVINYSKATKSNSSENHDNLLKVPSLWRSIIYLVMTYVILQLFFSFLEWVLDNSFKIFILILFGYFLNN